MSSTGAHTSNERYPRIEPVPTPARRTPERVHRDATSNPRSNPNQSKTKTNSVTDPNDPLLIDRKKQTA